MTAWAALERELATWRTAGLTATFWWRDDDAAADNAALERLFAMAAATGTPLALAAVPASVEPGLAHHFSVAPQGSAVLQHGYSHRNHAPAGAKKWELGPQRPVDTVIADLCRGRTRLQEIFGDTFLPVLVPPWNRIDPALTAALPKAGFSGLSTFGPRRAREAVPGLTQINCHIDLFSWKPVPRFLGAERVLQDTIAVLAGSRARHTDGSEPIGVMTHHLVHDEACWHFLDEFLRLLYAQAGACIVSPRHLWGPTGGG